mgnify:CR=1 FL=1
MTTTLTPEEQRQQDEIEKALVRRKLEFFKPYPKQLTFFDQTKTHKETLFMAGNQVGKTLAAAAMVSYFATGLYPPWWNGRRFDTATTGWVASTTAQATRDGMQRLLLGPSPDEWGTGMIPGRSIVSIKKAIHGVADSAEIVTVKHAPTGKTSRLMFKSYDQGRLRWQGETLHYVGFDEEPPEDIYSEGKTRTNVYDGIVFLTFTPLLGMSNVVLRFLKEKPAGSCVVMMGIKDALHYTEEQRARIIASYPEHERDARANGTPIMGSGAVFPVPEQWITESPVMIPDFWPRIAAMDFGWDHPTAAVWGAWDRDVDVIHIYDTHRLREATPIIHAASIKARGPWIPMMWPADGLTHDPNSGKVIATQYVKLGVRMHPTHATHPPQPGKKEGTGGYGTEAGILEMLQRMQTGRWKVSSTCADWFEEYRMYYRKDGLIKKEHDDLMSASRQLCMMIRHATIRQVRPDVPLMDDFVTTDSGMGLLG